MRRKFRGWVLPHSVKDPKTDIEKCTSQEDKLHYIIDNKSLCGKECNGPYLVSNGPAETYCCPKCLKIQKRKKQI